MTHRNPKPKRAVFTVMTTNALRQFAPSVAPARATPAREPRAAVPSIEKTMHIVISTDERIHASELLRDQVRESVSLALRRFSAHISEVDVQVTQLDASTAGWFEQRCWIEARLRGRQPMSVEQDSISLNLAVDGALQKLEQVIEVALHRTDGRAGNGIGLVPMLAEAVDAKQASAANPSEHG